MAQKPIRIVNAASKIRETGTYAYMAYKVTSAREGTQLVWDCLSTEKLPGEKKNHELQIWTSSEYGNGTDLTSLINAMLGGKQVPQDRADEIDVTKCLSLPFLCDVYKLASTKTDGAFVNKATGFDAIKLAKDAKGPSFEDILTPLE